MSGFLGGSNDFDVSSIKSLKTAEERIVELEAKVKSTIDDIGELKKLVDKFRRNISKILDQPAGKLFGKHDPINPLHDDSEEHF